MDKQYHFCQKFIRSLSEETSITKNVMDLCKESKTLDYYNKLNGNNGEVYLIPINRVCIPPTRMTIIVLLSHDGDYLV